MAKRGYKLQEFVAHSANVNCVRIGKKTRRHFIMGGDDEKVNLWSIGRPTSLMSLCGHTSPVESVAFDSAEVLVAAGSSAGAIKLWDLEETKVVRTLTGHRSYCTAVEFHPFGEFFASGSMDTNLKIWDIRKKGCIHTYKGHTRGITPDGRWVVSGGLDNVVKAAGVRSITFHPDGRTLFCGLDSSLKVYSWEPVICHDAVDMGWSTLGDLCINDGKLLGCSYYQNSVGVWAADVSHIEPYGDSSVAEQNSHSEQKNKLQENLLGRVGSHRRSTSISSDSDTKEIKNIYVDTAGETPVTSRKAGSSPKVVNLSDSKEISNLETQKQVPAVGLHAKNIGLVNSKSFVVPSLVPRDSPDGKDSAKSRRESIASGRGSTDTSLKPPHIRRPSITKLDVERPSVTVESLSFENYTPTSQNFHRRLLADDAAKESSEEKLPFIRSVSEKFEKVSSPRTPNPENCEVSLDSSKGLKPVKYVNGVAVVRGRTRSLVERFEMREKLNGNECQTPDTAVHVVPETAKTSAILVKQTPDRASNLVLEARTSPVLVTLTPDTVPHVIPEKAQTSPVLVVQTPDTVPHVISEKAKSSPMLVVQTPDTVPHVAQDGNPQSTGRGSSSRNDNKITEDLMQNDMVPHGIREKAKSSPRLVVQTPDTVPHVVQDGNPQSTGRGSSARNDNKVAEDLMQNHDVFLSTLRSRLTKLQVVLHFWERNDIKGAVNALCMLPDHSVQADVISVLMDKMETLTLGLFSCLLPVLLGLLDSRTERHTNLSLEMLLKLVAVFGPVVHSTISAPPTVGVDLHKEKRLECCNKCFIELQKIQKTLPTIIRRGGLLAKCAQELNLILQES